MMIVTVTSYIFHPVTEYKAMLDFEDQNDMNEWVKSESTVSVAYTRTQRIAVPLKTED